MEIVNVEEAPRQAKELFNKGFAAFERNNMAYAIDLLFACVAASPGLLQARKFLRAAEVRKLKQEKKDSGFHHQLATLLNLPTYLKAAAMAKSGKNPVECLQVAEKLLRADALNLQFIEVFAQAAMNADLPDAAIQTLEVARDQYPDNLKVINWLGGLYAKSGRTKSARECFEKLCELTPNDPEAIKKLKDASALESVTTGGWETAAAGGSYRDVMKDSEEAVTLEREAKAVKSESDVDALIEDAQRKIADEPANINYYRQLARLFSQKKLFDDAVATLEKAREINPGDPELDAAVTATQVQKYDHAVAQSRAAGDEAGAVQHEQEKAQYVFDDLQDRVKRYPNDLKLRYELGVMLFTNDYVDEAIQQFQQAQRGPRYKAMALYHLALCFKNKHQYDMALEQLERAGEEMLVMDENKKNVLYELGQVCEAMGDLDKAADYYKEIYQVDIGFRDIAQKVEQVYQARERGKG